MTERQLLKAQFATPEAPSALQAKVIAAIQRSLVRRICAEITLALTACIGIFGYILVSWTNVRVELQESSFFQLSRLLMRDPDMIASHLQEVGWSIAESIPFGAVALGLILLLCVTFSISLTFRLREIQNSYSLRLS